jgi:hypothetical protein
VEQKPNENGVEATDDSLFTSATGVQIPVGTPTYDDRAPCDRKADSSKLDPLRSLVREAVREGWESVREIAAANKHNREYELGLRSGSNTVAAHVYRAIHGPMPSQLGIDEVDAHEATKRELSQMRAHLRTALNAGEAAELRIVELKAKLSRVEALPDRWRHIQPPFSSMTLQYEKRCVFEQLTEELEAALK